MIDINIDGLNNVRDLGGYLAGDGKKVKSGLIFRGIRLSELTETGMRQFGELGIKNIFDLRDPTQAKRFPDPKIEGAAYRLTPAEIYSDQELSFDMADIPVISDEEARSHIDIHERHYVTMVRQPSAIRAVFECLLSGCAPVYFHCTAGKDRTGVTAAVILAALGVPYETIEQDYLLSASRRREHAGRLIQKLYGTAPGGIRGELLRCYLSVDVRWLRLAWEVIEEYGGTAQYLSRALGVGEPERQTLKQTYLEDI